jgi:hypothetical protein
MCCLLFLQNMIDKNLLWIHLQIVATMALFWSLW